MKLTIRNGMFETNSSSMHSIVICKDGGSYTEKELHDPIFLDGTIKFWENDLEFGRSPFELLTTWDRKLAFVIASLCRNKEEEDEEAKNIITELEKIVSKHIPECCKIKIADICYEYSSWPYGYIDHQSLGLLDRLLKEEGVSIEEFIFNKKYIVVIDGDEYCIFNQMKEQFGIADKIEKEIKTVHWMD